MATILITGCSRGIGEATALTLARAGHKVHATMRHPDGSPELALAAEKERLPIEIRRMDVTSDASVNDAISAVVESGDSIDVLVNNAGLVNPGVLEDRSVSEFRAVMETNYFGPLRCIKAVYPDMRARGDGCIINVSSVSGRMATAGFDAYCPSKFALEALTEVLAQEAKMFNVRVLVVEPGIFDTAMARGVSEQRQDSLYPHMRRFAGLVSASLRANPISPTLAAEKMLEIVENGTWQLRHPVGPDAEGFLQWRASLTDEQWVDWWAADDDEWYAAVERDFGMDARI